MNPLRGHVLARTTCPYPAVGNQVTNETAGGLESLARVRCRGINQVLAQEIALGPLTFLWCQSQPPESSRQGRVGCIANRARLWRKRLVHTHRYTLRHQDWESRSWSA